MALTLSSVKSNLRITPKVMNLATCDGDDNDEGMDGSSASSSSSGSVASSSNEPSVSRERLEVVLNTLLQEASAAMSFERVEIDKVVDKSQAWKSALATLISTKGKNTAIVRASHEHICRVWKSKIGKNAMRRLDTFGIGGGDLPRRRGKTGKSKKKPEKKKKKRRPIQVWKAKLRESVIAFNEFRKMRKRLQLEHEAAHGITVIGEKDDEAAADLHLKSKAADGSNPVNSLMPKLAVSRTIFEPDNAPEDATKTLLPEVLSSLISRQPQRIYLVRKAAFSDWIPTLHVWLGL